MVFVCCVDGSKLKRKKSKKMQSGSDGVVSSSQENCIDSSAVPHLLKHHSDKKHTQTAESELSDGHKTAKKKRNKTVVETLSPVVNGEDDADFKVEEKHSKNENRNAESLNSDLCSQPQTDQRSESGTKVGENFNVFKDFIIKDVQNVIVT